MSETYVVLANGQILSATGDLDTALRRFNFGNLGCELQIWQQGHLQESFPNNMDLTADELRSKVRKWLYNE